MSIVYLAKQAVNGLFATAAFLARSITDHTVTSPSDLTIFGKPSNQQVAYDAYVTNIEAFICATSIKKKLYCDRPHYPIDPEHVITTPIQLPRTVFALVNKPSSDGEKRLLAAGKDMGIEKREVGKGHVYTVERPTIEFMRKIEKIAAPQCSNITDYSQVRATSHFHWLAQCVDLFLATNTYAYKPETFQKEKPTINEEHPRMTVGYFGVPNWEGGCSKEIAVKRRKLEVGWENKELVNVDEVHEVDSAVVPGAAVFVAKPSPLPSKVSWGLPSECPNSKGLHFPYFEGLHHSDVAFTRDIITRIFFRNLGSVAKGPRDAFKEIRTEIGPAMTTPEGRVLNHILYGIDLALGTQTQLFLLFEKGQYYGFNLLGGYFSIWSNGWKEPAEENDLQAAMAKYRSHEASLRDLFKLLKSNTVTFTEGYKTSLKALKTSQEVALLLGNIDIKATHDDILSQIEEMIGGLVFSGIYRKMNAENLETAIDELLGNSPISANLHVYVPRVRSAWGSLASPYYASIGSFGARSFSLIDRSGKADEVPLTHDTFTEEEIDKTSKKKMRNSLPFFEKPFHECVADWAKVVQGGKARLNFSERAIGSRGFLVRGDGMRDIISIFEKAREEKKIGVGVPKSNGKGKGREKDGDAVMGEVVNIEDLF